MCKMCIDWRSHQNILEVYIKNKLFSWGYMTANFWLRNEKLLISHFSGKFKIDQASLDAENTTQIRNPDVLSQTTQKMIVIWIWYK